MDFTNASMIIYYLIVELIEKIVVSFCTILGSGGKIW